MNFKLVFAWIVGILLLLGVVVSGFAVPRDVFLGDLSGVPSFVKLGDGVFKLCDSRFCVVSSVFNGDDFDYPIYCLRENSFCSVSELNKVFFLKKNKCDLSKNPLCELKYLKEIK